MKLWSSAQKRGSNEKKHIDKKVLIPVVAGAAALVIGLVSLCVYAFTYDKVFVNVTVGDERVGGKTESEITELVSARGTDEYRDVEFDIIVNGKAKNVTAEMLGVERDAQGAAKAAMAIGRTGSPVKRLWTVFTCLVSKHNVPLTALVKGEKLDVIIDELAKKHDLSPVHAGYVIDGNKMTLTPPKDGVKIDRDVLREKVREIFENETYADIEIATVTDPATPIDPDKLYSDVHAVVQDAKMEEKNGEHKIVPHVVGIDFDIEKVKAELESNPNSEIVVPLNVTNPKVTTLMLQATLFNDVLSEKTTYFSPKKVTRTHNVRLAAKLINGKVLNPGEIFSYNETVGPRTTARGFQMAQIFAKGEVVDGIGGGICQVSSTLYMAAMYADMKTVSRKNHSFYVDYAPKGQDATVVYGSIDFKFQNTSPYPIKIVTESKNNYIKVTIKGTKTDTKTVKITSKTLATKPFTEKVIEDASLKPGERVIEQAGQEGITMEVYRSVYDANGKLITSYLENKTKYVPLTQIVKVGPKSTGASTVTPTPEQEPVVEPQPEPTPEPEQTAPPAEEEPAVSETPVEDETPPAEETPSEEDIREEESQPEPEPEQQEEGQV